MKSSPDDPHGMGYQCTTMAKNKEKAMMRIGANLPNSAEIPIGD